MTAALPMPRGLARYLPLVPFAQIQAEALANLPCPESREAWNSVVSTVIYRSAGFAIPFTL